MLAEDTLTPPIAGENGGELVELGKAIRSEFPYFAQKGVSHGAYLDSAASSLKPRSVVDRMSQYLSCEHANIHRGAYKLSAEATISYDKAREQVAEFIGAKDLDSVIFTRGTTESINLVARTFGEQLSEGDTILLTELEHHSNIVPWQLLQ